MNTRGKAPLAAAAAVLLVAVVLGAAFVPTGPVLPKGGDFTVQTADGPLSLRDLRGKVVLLYFGYLNCPDVCPMTIANDSQALAALKPDEIARTRLLYVSLDPKRDSPEQLKEYATYFHPAMIGATAEPDAITAMAKAYGVGYTLRPPNPDGSYAVDHTGNTYLVGPNGKLKAVIPFGASADEVVATVRKFLP